MDKILDGFPTKYWLLTNKEIFPKNKASRYFFVNLKVKAWAILK